jgi:hypothetical protein
MERRTKTSSRNNHVIADADEINVILNDADFLAAARPFIREPSFPQSIHFLYGSSRIGTLLPITVELALFHSSFGALGSFCLLLP